MATMKIPSGTRIYLMRRNRHVLNIRPDKVLANDSLYVLYDVRVQGRLVIPRGTRVVGDWVTESEPRPAAQFQTTRIYLQGSGQPFNADSDIIEGYTKYNSHEVRNAGYLTRMHHRVLSNGIPRRFINTRRRIIPLVDHNRDTQFVEIDTREIPITLLDDFVVYVGPGVPPNTPQESSPNNSSTN